MDFFHRISGTMSCLQAFHVRCRSKNLLRKPFLSLTPIFCLKKSKYRFMVSPFSFSNDEMREIASSSTPILSFSFCVLDCILVSLSRADFRVLVNSSIFLPFCFVFFCKQVKSSTLTQAFSSFVVSGFLNST